MLSLVYKLKTSIMIPTNGGLMDVFLFLFNRVCDNFFKDFS